MYKMPFSRMVHISRAIIRCGQASPVIRARFLVPRSYGYTNFSRSDHKSMKIEKEKLRTFIVQRYLDYVKNYTTFLEVRFPTAVRMYRVFSVGIKDFLKDLKTYITLRFRVMKDKGFSTMTRREIELYQKMPSDMWKIAPVLFLSAIPFGNYIIFPLAFWKPRTLLCSHFWSIQQRAEFSTHELQERLGYNRPVFRALQAKHSMIENIKDKQKFGKIVGQLGSGVHPTTQDILDCLEMFRTGPFTMDNLSYKHKGHLMKMHGMRKSVLRKNKLKYRAFILLEMDKAIIREGGTEKLSTEDLRQACHLRGLNDAHLSNAELKVWLDKWINVTKHLDKSSYSLVLHCPIFFAYNHPQNWVLIY